jgi:hypothetical protein
MYGQDIISNMRGESYKIENTFGASISRCAIDHGLHDTAIKRVKWLISVCTIGAPDYCDNTSVCR